MSERLNCYSREDILNDHFLNRVQKSLCYFLGHNLAPMTKECWPKEKAKEKAHEVNQNRYLSGCEENFIYARVSVEGFKKNQEMIIEQGLKMIVERWIERYGEHIRRKRQFMPYFTVSQVENFKEKDAEETILTICMAAYIQ